MRTVHLREFATSQRVPLSAMEADTLRMLVRTLQVQPTPGHPRHYDLRPGAEVGVVYVGDLVVELRPKLPIQRVLFLLSYASGTRWWRDDEAPLAEDVGLFEAVIPGFAFQVRRALRRGLLQGYQTREEALSLVRGRIRFDDQIRFHYGRLPPVEVRYDEFTEDIEANRLIKAAITRLRRIPLRHARAKRQLAQLDSAMAAVADVAYDPYRLPVISYNRLNEHYRPAVELARVILRGASFDLNVGGIKAGAVLFDMNKVFEDFVVAALRDQLALSERAFPQGAMGRRLHLDRDLRVKLEPDISWWEDGRAVFVGDVKYKRTTANGVLHADIYQVLAYTIATDLPGALLIYAAGESDQVRHYVPFADKTIEVVTMRLDGAPSVVLGDVQRISERVRGWRAEPNCHQSLFQPSSPPSVSFPP